MTHAEIKEGRETEIHNGDEGITIQGKKGGSIHKNASETDPALKIDHNGSDVVKRAREIEVVENTGEGQVEESKEEEPTKATEDGTENAPIEIVGEEKEQVTEDTGLAKEVETALEDADEDVQMESPKKNGNEKSAGEKRDRDDLEDLEDASSGGEREMEEDAVSTGENGVKKHKTEHSENADVTAVPVVDEVVEGAPKVTHIDENIQKVEAEEAAVAGQEDEIAVQA